MLYDSMDTDTFNFYHCSVGNHGQGSRDEQVVLSWIGRWIALYGHWLDALQKRIQKDH